MMEGRKKRPVTLLEMMIVIFIIGIISSVVGYNVKGSLDESKAFKSEHGSKRVYELLNLELAKGSLSLEDLQEDPEEAFIKLSFSDNPKKLLKDGWGQPYRIEVDPYEGRIRVVSDAYLRYLDKKELSDHQKEERAPWMF